MRVFLTILLVVVIVDAIALGLLTYHRREPGGRIDRTTDPIRAWWRSADLGWYATMLVFLIVGCLILWGVLIIANDPQGVFSR